MAKHDSYCGTGGVLGKTFKRSIVLSSSSMETSIFFRSSTALLKSYICLIMLCSSRNLYEYKRCFMKSLFARDLVMYKLSSFSKILAVVNALATLAPKHNTTALAPSRVFHFSSQLPYHQEHPSPPSHRLSALIAPVEYFHAP